jgi:hypothetical protein
MVAAAVWIVALFIEYQYGLRTAGGGSAAYQADQTAFLIASVGYLALLIRLFRSKAAGDGLFGRIAVGIWTIALTAVALSQALSFVAVSAVFLLPIGGVGQILGSLFTSIAVWRTRRRTGWRPPKPYVPAE